MDETLREQVRRCLVNFIHATMGDPNRLEEAVEQVLALPALAERAAVERVKGWRDIASAPRDGTQVLLWAEAWEWTWGLQIGSFNDGQWEEGSVADNEPGYEPDREVDEDEEFDEEANLGPTHWQPLPKPPAARAVSSDNALANYAEERGSKREHPLVVAARVQHPEDGR